MPLPPGWFFDLMAIDWHELYVREHPAPAVIDPRRRLRICLACFVIALLVVLGRTVQLEITQGADFRAEATRPIEKRVSVAAARGRILARDGNVLAGDQVLPAVAIQYRWLEEPPDAQWLRATARARLPKAERRNAQRLAAAYSAVLAERAAVAQRLAELCRISSEDWTSRTRAIQARVAGIAERVNRLQQTERASVPAEQESWGAWVRQLLLEEPPPPRIVVAEELDYHVLVDDPPAAVAAEIQEHPECYPGVKIVEVSRRTYPHGALASHVLGHLGPVSEAELAADATYLPSDLVGRTGVERQYETALRGQRGAALEQSDRNGRLLGRREMAPPRPGADLTLTLDPALQKTAEDLLRDALARRALRDEAQEPAGGAIVAMNIADGAVCAAAAAPGFDPNCFVHAQRGQLQAVLTDPARPLFDRISQMTLPPGSTFKALTALALLQTGAVDAQTPFTCRGYLHRPDQQRCELFVRQGVGHGEIRLADALAESCNVYFFHFAGRMGPRPLVDWARRFGFGRLTGVDLPDEAAGALPCPENIRDLEGHPWRTWDTEFLAVGQSSLTATPLQVLCMMAAIANGGRRVAPHLAQTSARSSAPPQPIPGLNAALLAAIRTGLERTVADPKGTAYGTVRLASLPIAGKTGTAETGAGRASHAWFAGYAPAAEPRMAFVVVLEHAGDAATAAGPVAKRLVLRMQQLGLLQ